MRISTVLVTTAAAGATLILSTGPAMAGEITGNGQPPGGGGLGASHAHSICAFSGLEDGGDYEGQPAGPGAPPQNWGHAQRAERAAGATEKDLKASGFQPGDSCNGHTGFLAGGGEE